MIVLSSLIEYVYMQTTYEELMKYKTNKLFSWEKQTQAMTKLRTKKWRILAGRLKIVISVEESLSNSFQWRSKILLERLCVLTVKITYYLKDQTSDKMSEG